MLVTANLRHLAHCEGAVMTFDNIYSQMEIGPRQLAERYAEYPGGSHDQLYYPYEPAPGPHVPVVTKHYSGGGQKNNAAMSALTLLAFLFFLHILQQCLKDHMTAMGTPQVMIMTGGRDGEENIAKASHKVDKTGVTDYEEIDQNTYKNTSSIHDEDKYLMKITTSENAPWKTSKKQNVFRHYVNRSSTFGSTFGSRPVDGL